MHQRLFIAAKLPATFLSELIRQLPSSPCGLLKKAGLAHPAHSLRIIFRLQLLWENVSSSFSTLPGWVSVTAGFLLRSPTCHQGCILSPTSNVFPSDAAMEGHTLAPAPVERNREGTGGLISAVGSCPWTSRMTTVTYSCPPNTAVRRDCGIAVGWKPEAPMIQPAWFQSPGPIRWKERTNLLPSHCSLTSTCRDVCTCTCTHTHAHLKYYVIKNITHIF